MLAVTREQCRREALRASLELPKLELGAPVDDVETTVTRTEDDEEALKAIREGRYQGSYGKS